MLGNGAFGIEKLGNNDEGCDPVERNNAGHAAAGETPHRPSWANSGHDETTITNPEMTKKRSTPELKVLRLKNAT